MKVLSIGGEDLEHSFCWVFFQCFQLLAGNYVYQKIEYLGVVNARVNVAFLKYGSAYLEGASFGLQCEGPGSVGEFDDEGFTGFSEENWCF